MKKIAILLSFFCFTMCRLKSDSSFDVFYGSWYINEMEYKNQSLTFKKGDIINRSFMLGFEKNNFVWIDDLDTAKTVQGNFQFSKLKEKTFLIIKNGTDKRINGKYEVLVDTLEETRDGYILEMFMRSPNTTMIAHRNYSKQ